jgi:hypothetical protein
MISALEIGFALSLVAAVAAYVSLQQPRAKPVPIRVRDASRRRGPQG